MVQGDVDSILGLIIFFSPLIAAFLLATFSRLRQLHQPIRAFAIGIATAGIAGFFAGLGMLCGTVSNRALLIIVVASIVLGAFFSLLVSSESITQKNKRRNPTQERRSALASVVAILDFSYISSRSHSDQGRKVLQTVWLRSSMNRSIGVTSLAMSRSSDFTKTQQ